MNKEEAIEKLEELSHYCALKNIDREDDIFGWFVVAIQVIENILESQKVEIETLKRDFKIVDHECSRLEQEDIKKDMIINEMAEQLTTPYHSKEDVIDYYKKEIEK